MTDADWSILEDENAMSVARSAAEKVASDWSQFVEYDDVYQEALIILASKPREVQDNIASEYGYRQLHHWLWCDLVIFAKTQARRRGREEGDMWVPHYSRDSLLEAQRGAEGV